MVAVSVVALPTGRFVGVADRVTVTFGTPGEDGGGDDGGGLDEEGGGLDEEGGGLDEEGGGLDDEF